MSKILGYLAAFLGVVFGIMRAGSWLQKKQRIREIHRDVKKKLVAVEKRRGVEIEKARNITTSRGAADAKRRLRDSMAKRAAAKRARSLNRK